MAKGTLFLIHWDADEVEERADALRSGGWRVDVECEDGGRACRRILAHPPEAVVISLDRLPSHGRATALDLRSTAAGRRFRLIFVDGKEESVSKARARIPEAGFTTSAGLEDFLAAPPLMGLPASKDDP